MDSLQRIDNDHYSIIEVQNLMLINFGFIHARTDYDDSSLFSVFESVWSLEVYYQYMYMMDFEVSTALIAEAVPDIETLRFKQSWLESQGYRCLALTVAIIHSEPVWFENINAYRAFKLLYIMLCIKLQLIYWLTWGLVPHTPDNCRICLTLSRLLLTSWLIGWRWEKSAFRTSRELTVADVLNTECTGFLTLLARYSVSKDCEHFFPALKALCGVVSGCIIMLLIFISVPVVLLIGKKNYLS